MVVILKYYSTKVQCLASLKIKKVTELHKMATELHKMATELRNLATEQKITPLSLCTQKIFFKKNHYF